MKKEQYLLNRAIELSNNLKPSTVYNREYYLKNKIYMQEIKSNT